LKLKLKVKVDAGHVNHKHLTAFLNSNNIIELDISELSQKLSLKDSFKNSLRSLKINDDKFIDLKKFKAL
jgi:hypothetical protein